MDIRFRRVEVVDLPLLNEWVTRPHVAEWWDAEDTYEPSDLADPQALLWIVSHGTRDFAFAQDYAVHGFGPHHFDYLPEGARGIDQFIAEADMIGHGYGSALVRDQLARLFAAGAPVVCTDPHPENARAIRAYEKAGFRAAGETLDTPWGVVRPMACWRS
ncbi:MAG TPA: GNAT family N-acetyltransferase [Polyangiales bacterium]|nr:GNAT family N-acetyltransferase [Polyangiales bacterium]